MFNKISFKKRTIDLVIIGGFLYSIFWKKTSGLYLCFIITECKWHGVKVGPGPQDPRTRDLRTLGPGTRDPGHSSKFKSGTQGPPSKCKSRTPGLPSKFKKGPLHLSLMFIFVSFLNKIQRNINCE